MNRFWDNLKMVIFMDKVLFIVPTGISILVDGLKIKNQVTVFSFGSPVIAMNSSIHKYLSITEDESYVIRTNN
jgi:hypothetical protein